MLWEVRTMISILNNFKNKLYKKFFIFSFSVLFINLLNSVVITGQNKILTSWLRQQNIYNKYSMIKQNEGKYLKNS